MTFQPPTIVISTPTIGFSTDHYSRFNRPLGVYTAHNWRFNRPVLAFQPPTIGVSTAHWAFQPLTIGVSIAHYWRFKRPLGVSNAHYWRFSTAHYWRFNRQLLAFQPPTAFQTPTFFGANFGLDPASCLKKILRFYDVTDKCITNLIFGISRNSLNLRVYHKNLITLIQKL